MPSSRTSISRPAESSAPDLTGRLLRHERWIVAAGVALVAALAWWFVLRGAGMSDAMDMQAMQRPPISALLLMWWVMMVAMMLPSAAPAVLLYGRVRHMRGGDEEIASSWLFLAGYTLAWLGFSIVAAGAHWLVAGPSMTLGNRYAEGAILIAAGFYQMSLLKSACLRQCRSPAQFISRHWKPGAAGAVRLGILHGAYCVGCCWLLMALLFVGGVMNVVWIVALTAIVVIEKLFPLGDRIGRLAGIALIAWGAIRLMGAV